MTVSETMLDRVIGPDAFDVSVGGVILDSTLVGPVTIRHGRDEPTDQPDASTCSVTIEATATDLPSIGDALVVELGPDARAMLGLPLDSVNLLDNPRSTPTTNGLSDWAGGGGVAVLSARTAQAGWANGTTTSGRQTWTTAAPGGGGTIYGFWPLRSVKATSRKVGIRWQLRSSVAYTGATEVVAYDAALASLGSVVGPWVNFAVPANVVVDGTFLATVPPGTAYVQVFPANRTVGAWAVADWVEVTNLLLEADVDVVGPFFDGNTADLPLVQHSWTGGVNASTSTRVATPARRFTGSITDLQAIPAQGVTGHAFVRCVAASPLAKLGRVTIGDAPWPAELDGVRADRILDLVVAQVPSITVAGVDPGFYSVNARDVDRKDALGLLRELAADALGVLAQNRDGSIDYQDADSRQGAASRVTLDASQALASSAWTSDLAGLVNDLTVAYGGAEPQAETRLVDPVSIAAFGPYAARVATQLEVLDGADDYALAVVGRYSRPAWRIDGLTVELIRSVPLATAAILLDLEVSDLLTVTGFPSTGPFVTSRLWVEGWTETIERDAWVLALNVSGYRQGGTAGRWADVDPAVSWDEVPSDVSWLGFASWEFPEADLGRWLDEASDLDWTDAVGTWLTH